MKTHPVLPLFFTVVLCAASALADGETPRVAEDQGGPSPEAAASAGAPLSPERRAELHKELFALQKEIRLGRLEAGKSEDVQAIRAKIAALSEETDAIELRKLSAEARRLTERHLAEQPGMAAKLARLRDLGRELRRDLPAEARRRGKQLPEKKAPEAKPAAPADLPPAP